MKQIWNKKVITLFGSFSKLSFFPPSVLGNFRYNSLRNLSPVPKVLGQEQYGGRGEFYICGNITRVCGAFRDDNHQNVPGSG